LWEGKVEAGGVGEKRGGKGDIIKSNKKEEGTTDNT
jgi:hypothetical protein